MGNQHGARSGQHHSDMDSLSLREQAELWVRQAEQQTAMVEGFDALATMGDLAPLAEALHASRQQDRESTLAGFFKRLFS